MNYDPLPPPKIVEPSFSHLSVRDRIAVWGEMVDAGIELVLAGQQRRTDSEVELRDAFREWLETRRAERSEAMQEMMQKFREHGADA